MQFIPKDRETALFHIKEQLYQRFIYVQNELEKACEEDDLVRGNALGSEHEFLAGLIDQIERS